MAIGTTIRIELPDHGVEAKGNITVQQGHWFEVVWSEDSGAFMLVDENLTNKEDRSRWPADKTALAFYKWDEQVVDLDDGFSDEGSCFGMSNHVLWNDVNLTPTIYRAPSIERLKEAFTHVTFCAWCSGDI